MNIDRGETYEDENRSLSKLEFPNFNEILNVKLQ